MYFHDEKLDQAIIGEAALSLALCEYEITVDALIKQLSVMAERETSEPRLLLIFDARSWLMRYRSAGHRQLAELNWLTPQRQFYEEGYGSNVIRLPVSRSREKE